MRIWLVHPQDLDDQRVLAAHNEIHMAVGLIKMGRESGKINPLIKRWNHPEGFAAIVHYHDIIVAEMERRGWSGHKTPMMFPLALTLELAIGEKTVKYANDYWPPLHWMWEEDIEVDRATLTKRWEDEGKVAQLVGEWS